ncbi:MAG: glycosyltransferase family 2 protein [Luteibaculaceae bacterium]
MLISIIIPCFNVTAYIEECLASVYAQTYRYIEVIAVDNNSVDNTLNVLKRLKDKYYPDLIIVEESLKGAPAARNKGLSIAKGEWIQFLDADDLLKPQKLENQIKSLGNSNAGLIISNYLRQSFNKTDKSNFTADLPLNIFSNRAGITSANLWRQETLLKLKGWKVDLGSSQETELMFRLYLNGCNFMFLDDTNTIIRQRESGQISQRNPVDRLSTYLEVRLSFLSELKKKNPDLHKNINNKACVFLINTCLELSLYDTNTAKNYYNRVNTYKWRPESAFGLSKFKLLLLQTLGFRLFSKLVSLR